VAAAWHNELQLAEAEPAQLAQQQTHLLGELLVHCHRFSTNAESSGAG
jgi:hypothetical protein